MIYKDSKAKYDHENRPAEREHELCLNCGKFWGKHCGWSCKHSSIVKYSDLPKNQRYLTESMRDSIPEKDPPLKDAPLVVQAQSPIGVNNDWRFWQHHAPGECPCGISRKDCPYHKD